MWHAVYSLATGALFSLGTVLASPMPKQFGVIELGPEVPAGEWNPNTLSFEVANG